MSSNDEDKTDDLESLLRGSYGASEPTEQFVDQLHGRLLGELACAAIPAARTRSHVAWRRIIHHPLSRIAAAAVLTIGIAGIAVWFHAGGTTPAFADFLAPILNAKTVTFKSAGLGEGQPQVTAKMMVMAPNRLRMEQEMPGHIKSVTIFDADQGKTMLMLPMTKTAVITTYVNVPKGKGHSVLFLDLRAQLAEAHYRPDWICESLGEKESDGRRLVGYRLTGHGLICDLWGDPKTRMPVRIESSAPSSANIKLVYSDFVFDAELDPALFSLEPPAGYQVRKQTLDASPAQEKDLLETFRRCAQLRDGRLPDQLDLTALSQLAITNWLTKHPVTGGFPSQEQMQGQLDEITKLTRGVSFAFEQLPREADAHYAGKGVKLGAADTPVFWYRPKDANKYRVIYADLSVREAEKTPSVPNAQRIVSASGPAK